MSERLDGLSNDHYYTEGFRGNPKKYWQVRSEVEGVLTESFGEIFVARHGKSKGTYLTEQTNILAGLDLSQAYTSASLLRESGSKKIVGLTYAFPVLTSRGATGMYDEEARARNMSTEDFWELQKRSAEVGLTAIAAEHRGKGGWTIMMNNLESQLFPEISHVTQFVRTENGYADKIQRRYGKNIEYARPYMDDNYVGEQVYFRAELKKT